MVAMFSLKLSFPHQGNKDILHGNLKLWFGLHFWIEIGFTHEAKSQSYLFLLGWTSNDDAPDLTTAALPLHASLLKCVHLEALSLSLCTCRAAHGCIVTSGLWIDVTSAPAVSSSYFWPIFLCKLHSLDSILKLVWCSFYIKETEWTESLESTWTYYSNPAYEYLSVVFKK